MDEMYHFDFERSRGGPPPLRAQGLLAAVGRPASSKPAPNRPDDVRLVQSLLNANLPGPLRMLEVNGVCNADTIDYIEIYQTRKLGMKPPDGRIDPGGRTFLTLSGAMKPPGPPSRPTPLPPGPNPGPPAVPPFAPGKPRQMRQAAWDYLLVFTRHHEYAVLNFYNNRASDKAKSDVTCGIGFVVEPRSEANSNWIRPLFYNRTTMSPATPDELLADYDAAFRLFRTGNNLAQYANITRLAMYPDRMNERMGTIFRELKLPAILGISDFADFENMPAAAPTACLSFAYGIIPNPKNPDPRLRYPSMRAAIGRADWRQAGDECGMTGASAGKNRSHKGLFSFAQEVKDKKLPPDTMPRQYDW